MQKRSRYFKAVDIILLILIILPLVCGMIIRVLTTPVSEDIEINGARIFFTLKMPFQDMPITESQINSWLVIISVFWLCIYLTHGLSARMPSKRQHFAEWIIEKTEVLVNGNMGDFFSGFAPFIAAIMGLSAFSSLISLIGLYPPTSDLNIVGGWAVLVFFLITYYKMKCGIGYYFKSFGDPIPLLAPLNIISEISTPVSMAFRHYGNILSGSVISVLVGAALQGLSAIVLGKLPGIFGEIPLFRIGIPAVLSIYFDIFSGCLQAFIFSMLTMLYVSNAFSIEAYERKLKTKNRKIITQK